LGLGCFEGDDRDSQMLSRGRAEKGVIHFLGDLRPKELLAALRANAGGDVPEDQMLPFPAIIPFDLLLSYGSAAVIACWIFSFHLLPRLKGVSQ
jgi:hypothetical protein